MTGIWRGSAASRLYEIGVILVGLALPLLFPSPPAGIAPPPQDVLIFFVMAFVAERIYLPPGKYPVGTVFATAFSAFLFYGSIPPLYTLFFVGSILARVSSGRYPWTYLVFMGACEALGFNIALEVYSFTGGTVVSPLSAPNWVPLSFLLPVYFLISRAAMKGYALVSRHTDSWSNWHIWVDTVTQVVLTGYGLLMALAFRSQGYFGLVLVYISLLAFVYLMRLHTRLGVANRELQVISDVSHELGAALRREKVAEVASKAVARLVVPDFVGFFLPMRSEGGMEAALEVASFYSPDKRTLDEGAKQQWVSSVMRISFSDDTPRWIDGIPGPYGSPCRQLVIPLMNEGEMLGLIAVGQREENAIGGDELRSLHIIRGPVSTALANAMLYEKAEVMAVTDPMTGLYNYRYLHARLDEEITRLRQSGDSVGLIYLDINHFKHYNDTFGHQAGDQILCQFARLISESVRHTDIPARYGGDEFVVILPKTNAQEAWEVVKRIRLAVGAHAFRIPDKNVLIKVGFSAGVASFPEDGSTGDELIHKADKQMYIEKDLGRGCG